MNIPNYIERFYTAAQEKGFYDESWNITTEKALIITEICEAIQADRKDRRANVEHFKERFAQIEEYAKLDPLYLENTFAEMYQRHIKDTVEDEIAGAMGRIFGLMGRMKWYRQHFHEDNKEIYQKEADQPFPEAMYSVIVGITEEETNYALAMLILIAEKEKVDIEWHLEQVLRYNKTRPQKHGCKY